MDESTSHFCHFQSKRALVFGNVALLAKRDQIGELVLLPSLPAPGWRKLEEDNLVCGTAGALTGRHNRPAGDGFVWSEGEGTDTEWHNDQSVKVEGSICIEPNLEADSDEEPETGGMQETGQT